MGVGTRWEQRFVIIGLDRGHSPYPLFCLYGFPRDAHRGWENLDLGVLRRYEWEGGRGREDLPMGAAVFGCGGCYGWAWKRMTRNDGVEPAGT